MDRYKMPASGASSYVDTIMALLDWLQAGKRFQRG
jgi:hypothetical protein